MGRLEKTDTEQPAFGRRRENGKNFENIYKENVSFWEKISYADREFICQNSHMLTYPKGKNIYNGIEIKGK